MQAGSGWGKVPLEGAFAVIEGPRLRQDRPERVSGSSTDEMSERARYDGSSHGDSPDFRGVAIRAD
jgi:hypothetical protein